MSAETSPSTGRVYGVKRVCRVLGFPRSTFYAQLEDEKQRKAGTKPTAKKRGPKPKVSDAKLLRLVKKDLATTPFTGEGYRKVWARLKRRGVRVGRKRVLRVMRENGLLSPHRTIQGDGELHTGKIITDRPNVMWGTDGAMVFTVNDGWVWIFTAVDHWNAECVGWHVVKKGDRFAALEPIAMGLTREYGRVGGDVGRGLCLRMDNGTQYRSDHFRKQVAFWGLTASYAFVRQPETNGVAERFNRTLKEQAIYGRVFYGVEDLRAAVGAFVELYNREWLVEKNGFLSPVEARARYRAERCESQAQAARHAA